MTNPGQSPAKTPAVATPSHGFMFPERSPQLIALLEMDTRILAIGYRVSGVIGKTVVNDDGATIGKIEDLIIAPNEEVFYAVLSVGGFLGIGEKHVTMRYCALEMCDQQMLFRGASLDSLKNLPDVSLSSGERASRVIGADVLNSEDETVGTVEDLIAAPNDEVIFAVLSVGGFLGIGVKHVVVPYKAPCLSG